MVDIHPRFGYVTPEQRQRAGRAVALRISDMGTTVTAVARAAGVAPNTVRAFMNGERWPHRDTRCRLNEALGWPEGEIQRRGIDGDGCLDEFTLLDLAREVCRRIEECQKVDQGCAKRQLS